MPFRMGPWEIALILAVVMIVFGVGKLPQVGGALGKGIRSFRKAQAGEEDDDKEEDEEPKKKTTTKSKTSTSKRIES